MQPFWAECSNRYLAAIWRRGSADDQVWVLCPPFAEEEKCARRVLTEVAVGLQEAGHSSLLFNYSGTGDSEGDFAHVSLDEWRHEIVTMCKLARQRVPEAKIHLLGVRLGASLAAQAAERAEIENLLLLEPILDGNAYLTQLGQRQRLRGMLTGSARVAEAAAEDLDGWPLGETLKAQLEELRLTRLGLPTKTALWQIGARREVAPKLKSWASENRLAAKVLLMPPFWNRLDAVSPDVLLAALGLQRSNAEARGGLSLPGTVEVKQENEIAETLFTIRGKSGALAAALHMPPAAKNTFIVMLHGWSGYRTGPHQMLTRAARHFARRGFPVLRFDFAGRGDSDGRTELATLATMKDDLDAILDWVKSTFPDHDALLAGLCSGCEVAFAAAAQVKGMMLWSAPVFAAPTSDERIRRKRSYHLGEYARKLFRPSTYAKLLRGSIDVRGVANVLSHRGGESRNVESELPGQLPHGWRQSVVEANRELSVPILLIFGSADPIAAEALDWYKNHFPKSCAIDNKWIEGANHSYYGVAWERDVIEQSGEWLIRNFS